MIKMVLYLINIQKKIKDIHQYQVQIFSEFQILFLLMDVTNKKMMIQWIKKNISWVHFLIYLFLKEHLHPKKRITSKRKYKCSLWWYNMWTTCIIIFQCYNGWYFGSKNQWTNRFWNHVKKCCNYHFVVYCLCDFCNKIIFNINKKYKT